MSKDLIWNGRIVAYDRFDVPKQGELYQARDGQLTVAVSPTNKYPIFKFMSEEKTENRDKFWMLLMDKSASTSTRHYSKDAAVEEARRLMLNRSVQQSGFSRCYLLETIAVVEPITPEFDCRNIPLEK